MINYLKIYIMTHAKRFKVYLGSIILMPFAFILASFVGIYSDIYFKDTNVASLISTFTFGTVLSLFAVIPNYIFSKKMSSKILSIKFFINMIFSEIVTLLVFWGIGYLLYPFIIRVFLRPN